MNSLNIFYFAVIGTILQSSFICEAFITDTTLGKFIQNSANTDDHDNVTYRKLNKDAVVTAFKGFLQIVDDPLYIKRSNMKHNVADVVRSEGFVENLRVSNLKNATLDRVFISDDNSYAELKFTFPQLTIVGWYNMTFHLDRYNISVYGNSSFSVQLDNLAIVSILTLGKTQQGYTVVNKIAWNQTLSGIVIKINNLMDDPEASDVISENLSAILPTLHDSYKLSIDEFMGHAVMLYGKMLFFKSKQANLETIIAAFAKQTTVPNTTTVPT